MGNSQQVSGALNYTPGSPQPRTPVVLTLWTAQSVPVGAFLLTVTVTVAGRLRTDSGLPPLPGAGGSAAHSFLPVFSRSFKLFELLYTQWVG